MQIKEHEIQILVNAVTKKLYDTFGAHRFALPDWVRSVVHDGFMREYKRLKEKQKFVITVEDLGDGHVNVAVDSGSIRMDQIRHSPAACVAGAMMQLAWECQEGAESAA